MNLFNEPQLAPDAPKGLGAAMVGGGPKVKRRALTWRPDFLGGGNPTMECAWFVWQRGGASGTQYSLLAREDDLQGALL